MHILKKSNTPSHTMQMRGTKKSIASQSHLPAVGHFINHGVDMKKQWSFFTNFDSNMSICQGDSLAGGRTALLVNLVSQI
jgi:hypothetical protein